MEPDFWDANKYVLNILMWIIFHSSSRNMPPHPFSLVTRVPWNPDPRPSNPTWPRLDPIQIIDMEVPSRLFLLKFLFFFLLLLLDGVHVVILIHVSFIFLSYNPWFSFVVGLILLMLARGTGSSQIQDYVLWFRSTIFPKTALSKQRNSCARTLSH